MKYLLLVFLIFPASLKAQFYLGLNSSFNFGINGRTLQEFLLFDATVDQSNFQNTVTEKKASFGGGLFISPILGYKANKYIGFELQAGRYKTNTISSVVSYNNPSDDKVTLSMNGKVLSIRPSVLAYIYKFKPLIYTKVSAVYSNCEFTMNTTQLKGQKQTTILISGNKSLGFSFGAGADWLLAKRVYLRTEWSYTQANYFPEYGKFIKYEVNGINQLPNMSSEQKNIYFVKEGNVEQTYLGAAFDAGTHLSPQIPISSLGLNVSLIYKFDKRKNK